MNIKKLRDTSEAEKNVNQYLKRSVRKEIFKEKF